MSIYTGRKVLVTGGMGFIGSYLTERLVDDGAIVTVIDDLSRGKLDNLKSVEHRIQFIRGDLNYPAVAKTACRDQEFVFHLAGPVGGMYFNINNHYHMFLNTMRVACNVIEACVEGGVRVLYDQSTACVNEHDVISPTPEELGYEGEPEETNRGYGWAKRMSERLAKWAHDEKGLQVAIGRPWNAIGTCERDYDDEETSHVIPAVLRRIYEGQNPLVVYGTGEQERVFIWVEDLVDAILLTTERYAECDPVNLGVPESIKIKDLAQKLLTLTGNGDRPVLFDASKPEGYRKRAAVNTKLREIIGWEQKVSLDEALRRIVEWYKINRAPYLLAKDDDTKDAFI